MPTFAGKPHDGEGGDDTGDREHRQRPPRRHRIEPQTVREVVEESDLALVDELEVAP